MVAVGNTQWLEMNNKSSLSTAPTSIYPLSSPEKTEATRFSGEAASEINRWKNVSSLMQALCIGK